QKAELQERMKQLAEIGPQITSLERTKEMDEQNYKYYSGTLQKARVDEALDPSKMPNISPIQRPSPPGLVTKTRNKIALGIAGGVAAGISESGCGKVLLVDVYAANGAVHPFVAGRPAAALTTAMKPQAAITSAADNRYLSTVNQSASKSTHLGLKKCFALVPN